MRLSVKELYAIKPFITILSFYHRAYFYKRELRLPHSTQTAIPQWMVSTSPWKLRRAARNLVSTPSLMTSSNGNIFRVTGLLYGEFTGDRWIPTQRPVTRSFNVFFDLHLKQQLSKQRRRRWFETPSLSLWRHCNADMYVQSDLFITRPFIHCYIIGYIVL